MTREARTYPLAWPEGWPRTAAHRRADANFKTGGRRYSGESSWIAYEKVSIATGTRRVTDELARMKARQIVISTNLALKNDGLPRSGQREPADGGVAVYWIDRNGKPRAMAIDRYRRVADNLAAIAATLDAMRAIERHGGATIVDRAFTGFLALPPPGAGGPSPWWEVLDVAPHASVQEVLAKYRKLRSEAHPDRHGGDEKRASAINVAFQDFSRERGLSA